MATTVSNHSPNVGDMRHTLDSIGVLAECCEQSSTCRVQLLHCNYSVTATFVAMQDQLIQIQTPSQDVKSPLVPHALFCVTFSYGTSLCAFLGCLIDLQRNLPDAEIIFSTYPEQLMVTNLRSSFRVPIIENSGLETIVRTYDGQQFTVLACDITNSGMEFEFTDCVPDLSVGSMISIELKYRDQVVRRSAIVRRTAANQCGVAFVGGTGDHAEASRMRHLVLSLQQLWLRSRLA